MKKYVCKTCGYIYDPVNGDPDNGIAPGTAFEDLPEDKRRLPGSKSKAGSGIALDEDDEDFDDDEDLDDDDEEDEDDDREEEETIYDESEGL